MATITVHASMLSNMTSLIDNTKNAAKNSLNDLSDLKQKVLGINSNSCDNIMSKVSSSSNSTSDMLEELEKKKKQIIEFNHMAADRDKRAAQKIISMSKEFFKDHYDIKPENLKTPLEKLADKFKEAQKWVQDKIEDFKDKIKSKWEEFKKALGDFGSWIKDKLGSFDEWVKKGFGDLREFIEKLAGELGDSFKSDWEEFVTTIKEILEKSSSDIGKVIDELNKIGEIIKNIINIKNVATGTILIVIAKILEEIGKTLGGNEPNVEVTPSGGGGTTTINTGGSGSTNSGGISSSSNTGNNNGNGKSGSNRKSGGNDNNTSNSTDTNPQVPQDTGNNVDLPSDVNYSDAYKNSEYYQKLVNAKRTGANRETVANIALSQVGYQEGNLDGSVNKHNNHTEYGRITGAPNDKWCASFVSWCFRSAGVPENVMPTTAGARHGIYSWAQKNGCWHDPGSYTPQIGDIVCYKHPVSHVSIVVGVSGDTIDVVAGNTGGDNVKKQTVKYKDGYTVEGFASPNY